MPNIWKIAPGRRAGYWDECREGKFIAINCLNDLDLSNWTRDTIKEELLRREDGDFNSAQSLDLLVNGVQRGDTIVANRGLSKVVGLGIVRSVYLPPTSKRNPNRNEDYFTQVRRITWVIEDEIDLGLRLFNQPTVQPLNDDQCAAIKRAYLKWFPAKITLITELIPM